VSVAHNGAVPFVAGAATSFISFINQINAATICESVIAGIAVTAIWNSGRWVYNRLRSRMTMTTKVKTTSVTTSEQ
jgi:hypothetical protein